MEVLFTRSSETDPKATVTTNRLATAFEYFWDLGCVLDGDAYNITFKKGKTVYTTTFIASRGGTTLYGTLPNGFRMPRVGKGKTFKIIGVEKVNNG